jgi:hypothetical protein
VVAHGALGWALLAQGQFAAARAATVRALELLPLQDARRRVALQQLKQCDDLLALDARLSAVLRKEKTPRDAAESIQFAGLCQLPSRQLHVASAQLYVAAFTADPRLADDLQGQHRYNAACAAALASAAQGKDALALKDDERSQWRKQALQWLEADLKRYAKALQSAQPGSATMVKQRLQHWQQDNDLVGIRDAAALAKLSAGERATCVRLWADVENLLHEANGMKKL